MFQDGQRETATWEMSHVAGSILALVLARWHWDVALGAEAAAGDGDPPGQLSVAPVLGPKDAAKAAVAVEWGGAMCQPRKGQAYGAVREDEHLFPLKQSVQERGLECFGAGFRLLFLSSDFPAR